MEKEGEADSEGVAYTNHMYSSIKGIAGSAIQPVKELELPEGEDEI